MSSARSPDRAARARLFVALELPDPVREALVRWRTRLDRRLAAALRPVAPESLHVTLCFLGWRPEEQVERIAAACRIVAAEPAPQLVVREAMWLPRRRPRVLAIALEDRGGRLAHVQGELSSALAAGGWFEPETRPYLAHVTVARVGAKLGASGAGTGPRPPELPEPPRVEFTGARVVLYRSRLTRGGARYEALAGVDLAASTA